MRLVLIAVSLIVVSVGLFWLLQRRLIYFPSQAVSDVATALPGAEEVTFETEDGLTLSGWFRSAIDSDVTVIVFGGNAGNRGDRGALGRGLADNGYGVLLFDYRGYGGNPGRPTEEGLLADGRAAVDYLDTRSEVATESLVYFGESLGAGVAIPIAEHRTPAALILRSPFTSLSDVGSVHYPLLSVEWFLWDSYSNIDRIPRIVAPILIVAGSADGTVPVGQSTQLHDAANEPKELVIIEGADHNDRSLNSGSEVIGHVVDFIDRMISG